jgi:hypothetical protein
MDSMFSTPLAVFPQCQFFGGFGFVFLGNIAETTADAALETENLAGTLLFCHKGILSL